MFGFLGSFGKGCGFAIGIVAGLVIVVIILIMLGALSGNFEISF